MAVQTIGLRRFLPAFAFVGIAALLLVQVLDERVAALRTTRFYAQPPSILSDPIIQPHTVPIPVGIISILALPGLLPFALLGISPAAEGVRTPVFLAVIVVLTATAWYLAGRWLDRRLGACERTPCDEHFPYLNWILLVTWIAAVFSVTAVLLDIDFLGEMHWLAAGVVLWGIFGAIALGSRIRDYYLQMMDAKNLG